MSKYKRFDHFAYKGDLDMSNGFTTRTVLRALDGFFIYISLITFSFTASAFGSYSLGRQSVNSGGAIGTTSGNYTLNCSIGQTSSGIIVSNNDSIFVGFWHHLGEYAIPIELMLPDIIDTPNGTPAVPVIVTNFNDVLGLQIRIEFDSLVVSIDSVTSQYLSNPTVGIQSDKVTIVWDGNLTPISLADDDTLLFLYLECIGASGSFTPLMWDNLFSAVFDTVGNLVPLSLFDGSVSVENCCIGLRGDVNGDGEDGNILDLTCLVDHIFRGGCIELSDCLRELDVNSDGAAANILDLTFLVDYIFRGGPAPGPC